MAPPSLRSPSLVSGTPPPSFISDQVTAAQRFYHRVEPRARGGICVVCGGWEECSADYLISRVNFPYYSIEFVAAGEGEVVLGRERYALQPGVVFSYGPGVSQEMRTSPEKRLRKYFVDFTGSRARAVLQEAGLKLGTAVRLNASAEVHAALDTLLRIAGGHHQSVPRMCALQLELVLLAVQHATEPLSPVERRAFATFDRCRNVIEADFLTLRTVEQAAQRCHIDPSHLCRLFRRYQGSSPLRHLRHLQMVWAAQRLHESRVLIREVADALGIDAFQFSRTFKRIHGLSPSAFLAVRG